MAPSGSGASASQREARHEAHTLIEVLLPNLKDVRRRQAALRQQAACEYRRRPVSLPYKSERMRLMTMQVRTLSMSRRNRAKETISLPSYQLAMLATTAIVPKRCGTL